MTHPFRRLVAAILAFVAGVVAVARASEGDRPNLLWISAEDISAGTIGCYGGPAETPRIDDLAAAGVLFEKAYAAAPVCAPSRSAIITGVMPTTLGSLPMRCQAVPPRFVTGFPMLLREKGYWCANNVKTDYNLAETFDAGWNESSEVAHWRNRPESAQPFFAVFNLTVTHESGLFASDDVRRERRESLPPTARREPAAVEVPPFYPDTEVIRADLAHRQELASLLDHEVGKILDELAADGLAEDTIVVFWGDHGEGIPRGKRSLTEFGLRVPLIVRVPSRFRHLASLVPGTTDRPGTRTKILASLLDLGPTMLDLAGVSPPPWMEGRSFLGPHAVEENERTTAIAVRDRMDEREGHSRGLTDGRYRYVRHFYPWLGGDDLSIYADGVPITLELRRSVREGSMPAAGWWFSRTTRPVEELYDLTTDPAELRNLAADPDHTEAFKRLRSELVSWMRRTRDSGVLPEAILRREAKSAGSEYAVFHPQGGAAEGRGMAAHVEQAAISRFERLLEAMLAVGTSDDRERFSKWLAADDPGLRYWGVLGAGWAAVRDGDAAPGVQAIEARLNDDDPVVAIAAARWMLQLDGVSCADLARRVLDRQIASIDPPTRQAALTAIDAVGPLAGPLIDAVRLLDLPAEEQYAARLKKRILAAADGQRH